MAKFQKFLKEMEVLWMAWSTGRSVFVKTQVNRLGLKFTGFVELAKCSRKMCIFIRGKN
jgi:hypothetical protein